MTHKKELAELAFREKELFVKEGVDHRKIDTKDKQDARSRDTDLKKAGYKNKRADAMVIVAFICLIVNILLIALVDNMGAQRGRPRRTTVSARELARDPGGRGQ